MDHYGYGLVVAGAFLLGACPFSLWVSRWFLHQDITRYGDGNPGASNVFRAGGRGVGILALCLDIAKGMPFVLIARWGLTYPDAVAYLAGLGAIAGSAFSPFLGWRGGRSLAVTGGVLLAVPQREMLIVCLGLMFLGFLLIESDEWRAVIATSLSLLYTVVRGFPLVEVLFMLGAVGLLTFTNRDGLLEWPRRRRRLSFRSGWEEQQRRNREGR